LRHRREMFREMGGSYLRSLDQFESASRRYFEVALRAVRTLACSPKSPVKLWLVEASWLRTGREVPWTSSRNVPDSQHLRGTTA